MPNVVKNIIAIVLGIIVGVLIISLGEVLIRLPDGADVSTTENIKSSVHLLQPKHYLIPFLAHAIGTIFGAFVAAWLAYNNKLYFGLGIGFFFLMGGVVNSVMLPFPFWVNIIDILLAYIPMAYLGWMISTKVKSPWS